MSLIARFRNHLSYGSFKHISCSLKSIGVTTRHFAQPATLEDEEIDQRMLPTDYDPANFDPTDHGSPPTDRVWKLVDEVTGLTLVEAAELSDIMMDKFCTRMMNKLPIKERLVIKAGAEMKTAAAAKEEKTKPEKTTFELKIESYDAASKLKVIKEIRSIVELGLKEAKDLVEKAPAILKRGVSKEEAENIVEKMKALGAKVVME